MATSGIRELHTLLLERDRNRDALANGPRRIAAAESAIAEHQKILDAAKATLISQQKAADEKNVQFKTNQQKVVDQKSKLGMCKTNVEYDILTRQIDSELKQNDQIEGEYLELLEGIDASKAKVGELTKELEAQKTHLAKVKAEVAAAEAGLKSEVKKYEELAAVAAASSIPEPHAAYYKRLLVQKGADSIAAVNNASCEGCYTEIPPQHNLGLKGGDVILCKECGRFLYFAS